MGHSKSYRQGPAYAGPMTSAKSPAVSKGPVIKPEGTAVSDGNGGRKGMRSAARSKTKSGTMPIKNKGPFGSS